VLGHADRAVPLESYCAGLLMPLARKSVEPMAAVTAPARVAAQHQSLLHFVANAPWSDERMLARVRELVVPVIEGGGPIEAWIIDDTGFPKKGRHSVGVARQYCGQLGKQDNCQVAVSLSIANRAASLPIDYRLYLPEDWASDAERRAVAKVPETISFKTKSEIALEQIEAACRQGVPRGVVLMDAGYGNDTWLREKIGECGLRYVVGIQSSTTVWRSDELPPIPARRVGRGRPPRRVPRSPGAKPIAVKTLAMSLPKAAWRKVRWREGSAERLTSRFARVCVHAAHRDRARAQEWLLVEWPEQEREPIKYWLATVPPDIGFKQFVDLAKLRWRIERDYQELKQEFGLGHYEGRGWRGFHHHATLCIAAYGFLIAERAAIPPSAAPTAQMLAKLAVPEGHRPRGAAGSAGAPRPRLGRDAAPPSRGRPRAKARSMSVLRETRRSAIKPTKLMTQ